MGTKMTMKIALLLLLLAILPVAATPLPEEQCTPCPSACNCPSSGLGGCQVLCHDVIMGGMPPPNQLPSPITKMSFHNCSIDHIPSSYFKSFPTIQHLNLSHNSLHYLERETFSSLNKMYILDLSDNKLKSLPMGIFGNQTNLQYLYLTKNPIEDLPRNVFRKLVVLKTLSLESTALSELEENTIVPLKNLQKLFVGNCSWNCSGDLEWLGTFLKSHGHQSEAKCASPAELAGQLLTSLSSFGAPSFRSRQLLDKDKNENGEKSEEDSEEESNGNENSNGGNGNANCNNNGNGNGNSGGNCNNDGNGNCNNDENGNCTNNGNGNSGEGSSNESLPNNNSCDTAAFTSCIDQDTHGNVQVVLKIGSGAKEESKCQLYCFTKGYNIFVHDSGSECCLCGRETSSTCICDKQSQQNCGIYKDGTYINDIPVYVSKLQPTPTARPAVINVNSSSHQLLYFASVNYTSQPIINNIIHFKFPSAGVHNLTIIDQMTNYTSEFPVLVEDPIVSASIPDHISLDCTAANIINLTIVMGSKVTVKWDVINRNDTQASQISEPTLWKLYDKKSILVVTNPQNFSGASAYCQSLKASLLEVKNSGKHQMLKSYLDDQPYLLGAQKASDEWIWSTSGEVTFFSKRADSLFPSSSLKCISTVSGVLNPVGCNAALPFICQKEEELQYEIEDYYDAKEDRYYHLAAVGKDWYGAKDFCHQKGWQLASIKKADLLSNLEKNLFKDNFSHSTWIGLRSFGGTTMWTDDYSTYSSVPAWTSEKTIFPSNFCMTLANGKLNGIPCTQKVNMTLCSHTSKAAYIEQVPLFRTGAKEPSFHQWILHGRSNSQSNQNSGPISVTIFPGYTFSNNGTLNHWLIETNNITTKTVLHLQVLRINCPNAAYVSAVGCNGHQSPVTKCMPSPQSCSQNQQCPVRSQYCPWTKQCQKPYQECFCNNSVPRSVDSLFGGTLPEFTVVGETVIVLQPENSEKHLLIQAGDISISENDIIAIQEETNESVLKCDIYDDSPAIGLMTSGWKPVGSKFAISNTNSLSSKKCQIQGIYTQPVTVPINLNSQKDWCKNEQQSLVYEITISNHVSSYKLQKQFTYSSPVSGLQLVLPQLLSPENATSIAVLAETFVDFVWIINSGSDAQFSWNAPGYQNVKFTDKCSRMSFCDSLPYHFAKTSFQATYQSEPYQISAKAFNKINTVIFNISLLVQYPVTGLKIDVPKLSPIGDTGLNIKAVTKTGSHLQYEWTLNGTVVSVKGNTFDTSLIAQPGVYFITLRCSNMLSSETANATVHIYTPAKPNNLDITVDSVNVEEGKDFFLNITVNAAASSRVTFFLDFGDGSAVEEKEEYLASKTKATVTANYSYNITGRY